MDKYVIRRLGPSVPSVQPRVISRQFWWADAYQLDGKLSAAYKHSLLNALLLSYSEIGKFPQSNLSHDFHRLGHIQFHARMPPGSQEWVFDPFSNAVEGLSPSGTTPFSARPSVNCVEFDSKGIYVASVSSSGCLSIHDFETLYCTSGGRDAERAIPIVHFKSLQNLQAVRWNPNNQDEVACVASMSNCVYFYDIASFSQAPSETLQFIPRTEWRNAASLFDLSYFSNDKERMIACGSDNNVHVWDRRVGKLPTMSLPALTGRGDLNTLQLSTDEHLVLAGTEGGVIILWDLRGGRNSAAFVTAGGGYHPSLRSVQVAKLLEDIPELKTQARILDSSVHSISLNPSCGHHLGFHLNNGWSGVLDLLSYSVSHIHCPPYSWLIPGWAPLSKVRRRRPAWLAPYSIYATGCAKDCEINFLDFTPDQVSYCSVNSLRHVNHHTSGKEKWKKQLQTSELVAAIASHPKNNCLLAGTQAGSLLLIGQMEKSAFSEEEDLELSTQSTAVESR